jgi:hypothetical protein
MITLLFNTKLWGVIVFAVLMAAFGWKMYHSGAASVRAEWNTEKLVQGEALRVATNKIIEHTAALADAKQIQEKKDVSNQKVISNLHLELSSLRLRDPNSAGYTSGTSAASSAAAGTADGAKASGFLSAETSQFLRDFAREADEINLAYVSCKVDSENVRK